MCYFYYEQVKVKVEKSIQSYFKYFIIDLILNIKAEG